jgi:hypothetical protein
VETVLPAASGPAACRLYSPMSHILLDDTTRPLSVPPDIKDDLRNAQRHYNHLPEELPVGLRNSNNETTSDVGSRPTDLSSSLIRSVPGVVKTRSGSVLARGMILKSDHYPSGRALQLDINLQGAPNFRAPRQGDLNIFGVAQPRLQGLKAILSVLSCRPDIDSVSQCIWFSTREEPIG